MSAKRRIATIVSCPRCGGDGITNNNNKPRANEATRALRVVKRIRCCEACRFSFQTTELDSAELAELRRRAYLYERQVGSATE